MFTACLIEGSKWDAERGRMPADTDGDGLVTMSEAYYYIRTYGHGGMENINILLYPENSTQILWGRK